MVPERVLALLTNAFPGEEIGTFEETFGGYSNLTVKLMVGKRPLIAKIAQTSLKQADVRREAALLELLRGSMLPTPALVRVLEDVDVTVELLDYIDGTNGLHYFGAQSPGTVSAIFAAVGQVLAKVHQHTSPDDRTGLELAPRYAQTLGMLPMLDLDPSLLVALTTSLEDAAWHPPELRLVHGDPGLHNVLWNGELTALLDWEWAGWGNPLLDVAWIYWITRLRNLPPEPWAAFCAAYGPWPSVGIDPTPQALHCLVLGHIAFILVRARQLPTWDEWLRRAAWTAELTFPEL